MPGPVGVPNLRGISMTLRESRGASQNTWSGCWNDGARFLTGQQYEITYVVDGVGVGDCFAGGLIYGLMALQGPQEALEFAIAVGCLKHSIPGDFSRFTAEDVNALIKGGGSGKVQR